MKPSHILKDQDYFIESLPHPVPPKPNLLLVDVEPEFSSLLRQVLGAECTFLETFRFEQAETLSYFESIDIALISIKGKPHTTLNKSLDLILNLVDCHPQISIFISSDQLDTENSQIYLQDRLIKRFRLDSDQNALIHQIGNLIHKVKGINKSPKPLKPTTLIPRSLQTLDKETPPQKKGWEKHPGVHEPPSHARASNNLPSLIQPIFQKESLNPVTSSKSLFLKKEDSSTVRPTEIRKTDTEKISKDIPITFSPRNKLLIKNLVQELAHKIKNPLVSIKTFTDLLKGRFQDSSFREEFYPVVKKEIERIDQTIESLVDFSEQLESHTLQTDFLPLFIENVKVFNLEHHGFLKLSLPEQNLPVCLIDPHQCKFALHLLWSSLLDDLKNHSEIRITAGKYPQNLPEKDSLLIINFFLPAPVPRFLERLDVILAQWIFENFNAQLEETILDGKPILHLIFFPLVKSPQETKEWKTLPLSHDRRKKQVLIVFYDRRKSERRQNTIALAFKNRRKSS